MLVRFRNALSWRLVSDAHDEAGRVGIAASGLLLDTRSVAPLAPRGRSNCPSCCRKQPGGSDTGPGPPRRERH